jgi:NAD(P)-dependent dehydrogenase (short-subunit alcohol dehydrogenase family)
MFDLNNKIVIITGAAGLLGKQYVEAIIQYNGIPILLDINKKDLSLFLKIVKKKYPKTKAISYVVDITKEEEIINCCNTIIKKFGKIDCLINNAANNPKVESNSNQLFSRLENFPIEVWNKDIEVGLTGTFLCIKHFGTEISKNPNGGSIVNISSDLGLIAPDQSLYSIVGRKYNEQPVKPITYSVVKTAIIGITRYIATYWPEKNVRCNAICPGGVENNQNDDFKSELIKRIPLGRMANKNEFQGLLIYLLSDASSYITGSIIAADGGRSTW